MRTTMAMNVEIREALVQPVETDSCGTESNPPRASKSDGQSAGYIVYLTERELFEAYPRARRENPDAVVHFERQDDDLWSLEVYKSEAAKHAYLVHFYYREKALLYLDPLVGDELPPGA
jgi:hypothetical protein